MDTSVGLLPAETPYVNGRGNEFYQLFQRIPILRHFYFTFEANYETLYGAEFTKSHWEVPLTLVTIYLAAIYFGSRFMAKVEYKNIWNIRGQLAAWNLLLSTFSFVGAMRTVPHLLYNLGSMPFESTICTSPASDWGSGATGLWVQLFIFSKIPELWDTFYIVARKRPLIFLHWYHHVTVLLYCWHAYATEAPQALYFVAMNYSVHAVMYGYYFLQALKIPSPLPPWTITIGQISQMVVGTFIQLFSMYTYSTKGADACPLNYNNLVAGGLMYGSYFLLFVQFAVDRFILKKMTKSNKKTPAASSSATNSSTKEKAA